jgi:hypothetical protein
MIKGNPLTRPRVAATREQVDIEKHFIFAPRRHPAIARSRIYPRFVALVASLGGSSTETDSGVERTSSGVEAGTGGSPPLRRPVALSREKELTYGEVIRINEIDRNSE